MSLNPFKKIKKSASEVTDRLTELQNKLNQSNKNISKINDDEDQVETVEETREIYAQKSFDRFIKFMENKDKFTWQNNLELIKVFLYNF